MVVGLGSAGFGDDDGPGDEECGCDGAEGVEGDEVQEVSECLGRTSG